MPTQLHDFNPGVADFDQNRNDTGLFWTIPIDPSSVRFEGNAERASFKATGMPMEDYTDFANSINNGTSVDSTVSFDIEWFSPTKRVRVDSSNNRGFGGSDWGGDFSETHATAVWSCRQPGFSFRSDPANTSAPQFAFLGKERNGVFFP